MIKIGIIGYGNLAKGVESAIRQNPDMELTAVFTRRNPRTVQIMTPGVHVYRMEDVPSMRGRFDVAILCGGSATDLPKQTKELVQYCNVIDSFDTHAKIPEHFEEVNEVAMHCRRVAIISCGWDPGMFSLNRLYSQCILPEGNSYTFWGKGVSQGHSDAIRRIEGVQNAKQYTIPIEEALNEVRNGKNPVFTARQMHKRECFVVVKEGADCGKIEKAIKEMPNYFADYDTTVHFIDQEEFDRNHSGMAHGGFMLRSGKTGFGLEHNHIIEYSLKLDSNPEFTGSVLLAYARAACKLENAKSYGCKTVLDIPPAFLSPLSSEELRRTVL